MGRLAGVYSGTADKVTIDWFSYAVQCGKDPGMIRVLWRLYRTDAYAYMRTIVVGVALAVCCATIITSLTHILKGQNGPSLERVEQIDERTRDHEDRIRDLERSINERLARLERMTEENTADIALLTKTSISSLVGIVIFMLKEFLKLLQDRRK